jgi:hypothetical protein
MTLKNIIRNLQNDNVWASNPLILTLVWIVVLFLLLICPFISTRQRRQLCRRRIIERRWNIEGSDNDVMTSVLPVPHANLVRRYPIGDPRHRLTKKEAEEELKKFLIEKLTPFTKTIESNDFIKNEFDDDIEMGENQYSSVKKQDSLEDLSICSTEEFSVNESLDEKKQDESKTLPSLLPKRKGIENCECENGETRILKSLILPGPGIPCECSGNNLDISNEGMSEQDGRECIYSSECSICLNAYSVGDKVSWSGLACQHAFHQECIIEWIMTLGKKSITKAARSGNHAVTQHKLCNFDMACPICRMNFTPNSKGE